MISPSLTGAALKAKQKAEKPSADLGKAPLLKWLPVDALSVDRSYQRAMGPENWAHANRILREFCWLYYQPLCVAPSTNGGYVVIDGQHRLEAARKHPLIKQLPCYIVDAAEVSAQARAFVAFNGRRIGITRIQRFWASHAAGDATAARIHALCEKAGVRIVRSAGVLPPCSTYATATFEKLLKLGDPAILAGLKVLVEAQGEAEDAFKGCNIAAVVRIAAAEGRSFERPAMVKALEPIDLEDEIAKARIDRANSGGSIEQALEKRLRKRYLRAVAQEAA